MTDDGDAHSARRRRADGEISRQSILDAATEIAAERGYEGTSIGAVSAKCGLPASSIYWHFKNKDDLMAAVIEDSFGSWLNSWQIPAAGSVEERVSGLGTRIAKALLNSPDFIRIGLMLALERRPVELQARAEFLRVRHRAHQEVVDTIGRLAPALAEADAYQLATYSLAGADGLFIAKEIGGDAVDLIALFKAHARAVYFTAVQMIAEKERP